MDNFSLTEKIRILNRYGFFKKKPLKFTLNELVKKLEIPENKIQFNYSMMPDNGELSLGISYADSNGMNLSYDNDAIITSEMAEVEDYKDPELTNATIEVILKRLRSKKIKQNDEAIYFTHNKFDKYSKINVLSYDLEGKLTLDVLSPNALFFGADDKNTIQGIKTYNDLERYSRKMPSIFLMRP